MVECHGALRGASQWTVALAVATNPLCTHQRSQLDSPAHHCHLGS